MKLSCNKKQCDEGITKKHNGVSTKMMQSAMIKTNGKRRVGYNNSNTDNINTIILAADYARNKSLLLCFKYVVYMRYFEPLAIKQPTLMIMLNYILDNLSLDEYNSVYGIVEPIITEVIPDIIIKKTYYVVTRQMTTKTERTELIKYFIFKNYSVEDTFIPTYSYVFNVEHPSNEGMDLSFSPKMDLNEYKYVTKVGTPGTYGATVMVTLPQDISYNKLFIYNNNDPVGPFKYRYGGFTLNFLNILLDSVADKQNTIKCSKTPYSTISPVTPRIYTTDIVSENKTVPMEQTSILTGITFNGVHLFMYELNNKQSSLFYTSQLYGFNIGVYYLYVPRLYQVAFLNKNQENNFKYSGQESRKNTDIVNETEADGTYDFYYGTIKIEILGSFQPISMYTLKYGYLDAKSRLVFDDTIIINRVDEPELINL
jgi:hypothetical protein